VKVKVNLARAVERYKDAQQAIKDEVAKIKKEKAPPGERVPGEAKGDGSSS